MDPIELNCFEFGAMVGQYVECLLVGASLTSFHRHAADCDDCSSYLLSYRKMLDLIREERRIA